MSLCLERKESQNERVALVFSTLHGHLSLKSRSQLALWTQLLLAAGVTRSGPWQLRQGLVARLGSCIPVPFGRLNRSLLRVCDIHYPQHHNPHVPKTLRSLHSEYSPLEDQKQGGRTKAPGGQSPLRTAPDYYDKEGCIGQDEKWLLSWVLTMFLSPLCRTQNISVLLKDPNFLNVAKATCCPWSLTLGCHGETQHLFPSLPVFYKSFWIKRDGTFPLLPFILLPALAQPRDFTMLGTSSLHLRRSSAIWSFHVSFCK